MLGKWIEKFFRRTYVLMKLNFMFLVSTVMGGVIFGIGPAFLNVSDYYSTYGWQYEKMAWGDLWDRFKKNFKRGNALFYAYFIFIAFAVYNLFLSYQIKVNFILLIQFVLIFVIVFFSVSYLYAVAMNSRYDIKLWDLMKLSTIAFFGNLTRLLRFALSLFAIYFIYRYFPGLLMFGIFSGLVIVAVDSLQVWMMMVDEKIVYKD